MALGDQSKALRIISINKGWDPNVIEGTGENIANFNKAPDPWNLGDQSVGSLPQGISDSYPGDHPQIDVGATTFNTPDTGRENANRRTSGANPFVGKGA